MATFRIRLGFGLGLMLSMPIVLAAQIEDVQSFLSEVVVYGVIFVALVFALVVYTMRLRDDRSVPLAKVVEGRGLVHSVETDAPVTECVRIMARRKIGAVLVMDGERLSGIFTERDALNKVLAAGLDPNSTRVSAVMTRDPEYVSPSVTVGAAMKLITSRRFRHLPVVQDGKVIAVVSSGDLTHWLVRDRMAQAQKLEDLAVSS